MDTSVRTVIAPSETPARSLEQLKAQLDKIAAEPVAAAPLVAESARQPDAPDVIVPRSDVEALRSEVNDLHKEVARLQETVDAALAYLVGELGDENRRLKKDLASAGEGAQTDAAPGAPPPAPALAPPPPVDYGKDGYRIVKEWGRTPEQAKELGGGVSSLRGLICAVPPGITDDELRAVGKRLHEACAGYDNVNIDAFDDEAAARDYADRNVRSTEHFVLNVTRHKASGQDIVVIVRADGAREVVLE